MSISILVTDIAVDWRVLISLDFFFITFTSKKVYSQMYVFLKTVDNFIACFVTSE